MKRILVALLLAMLSACANIVTPTGTERHWFPQRGIVLQVIHTCTSVGNLYQAGRGHVRSIVGPQPVEVPLGPGIYGDRDITVSFQSLDDNGRVVGTYIERFAIDQYSTTARTWLIGRGGWTGGHRTSQCVPNR